MPRACTVCSHKSHEAIDEALVGGTTFSEITARYGVSKDSLSRHKKAHLSPSLAKVYAERIATRQTESLLDRVEALADKAETILDAATADGKPSISIAAIRELRGTLELLGKITGELKDGPSVVFNLVASPEWRSVQSAILRALTPYDEALAAVVAALSAHDALPDSAIAALEAEVVG